MNLSDVKKYSHLLYDACKNRNRQQKVTDFFLLNSLQYRLDCNEAYGELVSYDDEIGGWFTRGGVRRDHTISGLNKCIRKVCDLDGGENWLISVEGDVNPDLIGEICDYFKIGDEGPEMDEKVKCEAQDYYIFMLTFGMLFIPFYALSDLSLLLKSPRASFRRKRVEEIKRGLYKVLKFWIEKGDDQGLFEYDLRYGFYYARSLHGE